MANDTEQNKTDVSPDGQAQDSQADSGRATSGPFAIVFPPEQAVWNEARRLVADKNIRVEDLATCCTQDPVIVIELLRISNAMYFAGGRSPITSTRTAIVRLGSDIVLEGLERMSERQLIDNEDVSHWFEIHRNRCKRTAIVSRILAEMIARTLSDDCQAVGLIFHVGEMLAVAHFRERYVELAEELSRSGINYRLATDSKFDVERMGITYLRRNGIPEALLFALDRDGRARTPDRAIMKPLCTAAAEMVEAFDTNRWEKIAPGKKLPPKSALRMLQLSEAQYLKIYERASEYLFSSRLLDEKKKQDALKTSSEQVAEISLGSSPASADSDTLEAEIEELLHGETDASTATHAEIEIVAATPPPKPPTPKPVAPPPPRPVSQPARPETKVLAVPESIEARNEMFSLKKDPQNPKTTARAQKPSTPVEMATPVPQVVGTRGTKVVSSIANMFNQAESAEELLSSLLKMLVDDGLFEKSAIIVVSRDRKSAIVVAARGPNIGSGQKIALTDPLNPLVSCLSKVQSLASGQNQISPFGSRAFAISPIDADHDTPVALYADCGETGSITFEARRVFRTVVDTLNKKLPSLPGGIPVEI